MKVSISFKASSVMYLKKALLTKLFSGSRGYIVFQILGINKQTDRKIDAIKTNCAVISFLLSFGYSNNLPTESAFTKLKLDPS